MDCDDRMKMGVVHAQGSYRMSYNPCLTLYYMVRLVLWDTLYLL